MASGFVGCGTKSKVEKFAKDFSNLYIRDLIGIVALNTDDIEEIRTKYFIENISDEKFVDFLALSVDFKKHIEELYGEDWQKKGEFKATKDEDIYNVDFIINGKETEIGFSVANENNKLGVILGDSKVVWKESTFLKNLLNEKHDEKIIKPYITFLKNANELIEPNLRNVSVAKAQLSKVASTLLNAKKEFKSEVGIKTIGRFADSYYREAKNAYSNSVRASYGNPNLSTLESNFRHTKADVKLLEDRGIYFSEHTDERGTYYDKYIKE